MKWKWLSLVGISLLVGGCSDIFPPCPFPGAMAVRAPGDTINPSPGGISGVNCLYRLTLKSIDTTSGEIKATVAESAVKENNERDRYLFSHALFLAKWFEDFEFKNYAFHVYAFHLDDMSIVSSLKAGETHHFENVPDTHFLKLCGDQCLRDRNALIAAFYKKRE